MTALIVVLIVVLALILVGLVVFLVNLSDIMRYRRIKSM
jgi:hypothetical protein